MNLQLDLRHFMLGAFLLSLPLTIYPTFTDPMNLFGGAGGYAFLAGLVFQLVAAGVGFLDLKKIKASTSSQILWTLFFISFSFLAFPVYLYKRFKGKSIRSSSFGDRYHRKRDWNFSNYLQDG